MNRTAGVAAVVPAYDAADHLAETLDAILGQTLPAAEVCVAVDGGCHDDTLVVARSFEPDVIVVEHPPTTSMAARDLAVRATSAELVAACDADDVWLPHKLERQVEALATAPELDAVFCEVTEFGHGDGRVRRGHERISGRVASALVVRRHRLDAVGGFVSGDHLAHWIEWLSVAMDRGLTTGVVTEVLVRRRLRAGGYTHTRRSDTPAMIATMRAHLRRRRDATDTADGR